MPHPSKSVNANSTERTTYDYDPGMPFPKSITSPGGAVTKYDNYDPVGAAPQLVSIGADGLSPIQTYSIYNPDGRIAENGKPSLAGKRFQYSITGRVTQQDRRFDANSPWFPTTSNLATNAAQPLTTASPTLITTTFTNSLGDLVWKAEQPSSVNSIVALPPRFTCFNYDGEHHLLETILPEGNSIIYSYDGQWRRTSTSQGMRGVAPGVTETWATRCAANTSNWTGQLETFASTTYAPGGWPSTKTADGVTVTLLTDGLGRIIQDTDGAGEVRRRGYDRQSRVIWEAVMQPRMAGSPYGKPQPTVAQVAEMTEYSYDHMGRTVSTTRWHVEDQTALVKTIDYRDAQRSIIEMEAGLSTQSVFDGAGRLVKKILPDGSTITSAYSGNSGSVITRTIQTNNPNKPFSAETTVLDGLGFPSTVTDDLGTLVHAEAHDVNGLLRTSTDLAGSAVAQFDYDGFGHLMTEWRDFNGAFVKTASYRYDREDRRTAVTDGNGNTTTFQYDAASRLALKTDPLGRKTSFQYYSGTKRIYLQTDPSGATFTRTYDPLGRVSTETTTPGSDVDVGGRTTTTRYDILGNLRQVDFTGPGQQGWDNTVVMEFDSLGRKVREANSLFSFDVKHSFDLLGAWKTTTIAGASEQQSFDRLSRVSGVSLNGASLALYDYGAMGAGPPLGIVYSTGASATFSYDNRNRQTDLSVNSAGAHILSLHTALGADGIARERVYSIGGSNSGPVREGEGRLCIVGIPCPSSGKIVSNAFQVDKFGRVTGESLDVAGAVTLVGDVSNTDVAQWMQAGTRSRSYSLDAASNWKSWSDSASGADQPTIDARNAYMSFEGQQPIYDSDDNAVSIPDPTGDEAYSYDVYKHPLSGTKSGQSVSFVYDGLGRRIVEHDASGTHFILWDGKQVAARGDSRTDASHWTLEIGGVDIDDHVASVEALGSGSVRVYHQASDGSVIGLSDSTGLVEAYTYSAFGESTTYGSNGSALAQSQVGIRFGYHGQLYDPWTRTYSMRAREYRPAWGRFLSTDPIGLDGGLNLYAFANSSPLHLRDPNGTSPTGATWTNLGPWDELEQHIVARGDCSGNAAPAGMYCYGNVTLDNGKSYDLYGNPGGGDDDAKLGVSGSDVRMSRETEKEIQGASIILFALQPLGEIASAAAVNSLETAAAEAGANAATGEGLNGQFSIINWEGYPGGPQPTGPFRILEGAEYDSARKAANAANAALHNDAGPLMDGLQIHEIQPVKFSGDPVDIANKMVLSPPEHGAYTTFWNNFLRYMDDFNHAP